MGSRHRTRTAALLVKLVRRTDFICRTAIVYRGRSAASIAESHDGRWQSIVLAQSAQPHPRSLHALRVLKRASNYLKLGLLHHCDCHLAKFQFEDVEPPLCVYVYQVDLHCTVILNLASIIRLYACMHTVSFAGKLAVMVCRTTRTGQYPSANLYLVHVLLGSIIRRWCISSHHPLFAHLIASSISLVHLVASSISLVHQIVPPDRDHQPTYRCRRGKCTGRSRDLLLRGLRGLPARA